MYHTYSLLTKNEILVQNLCSEEISVLSKYVA